MSKKLLIAVALLVLAAFALTACAGEAGPPGPAGPEGPQGEQGEAGPAGESVSMVDLTCTECHNDTTIITGKKASWETSLHSVGTSAAYAGGRDGCAACHSGGTFKEMIAAGAHPGNYEGDTMDVTHQDCRTCHEIHTTYTGDDWALTTTEPAVVYAFEGVTFEGGTGNLCATCHVPRSSIAEADADGNIEVTSTHWGPHHGPQAAMLLGIAGAGEVEGKAAGHYTLVENTCVACHVGENDNHSFEPGLASCTECHADIENFDVNGLQTEVEAQLDELGEKLVAAGMWDEEGHPVVGVYEAAKAQALWNYIYIAVEDKSMGVHNPAYTKALLESSLAAFE